MYVYVESEAGLWTVGYYKPDGTWVSESDHHEKRKAASQVNYLNGGNSSTEPGPQPIPILRRRGPL